jgi:secondary thiamine-phosphate synthase enzyme
MELSVSTSEPLEVVDVTERVEAGLDGSVESGTVTVFVAHTTAAVVVNEAEPRLLADVEEAVAGFVPDDREYRHDEIDDNAAAHLRAVLLGESVTVPVEGGELALGTWQSILLVECDGPRSRRLHVTVTES